MRHSLELGPPFQGYRCCGLPTRVARLLALVQSELPLTTIRITFDMSIRADPAHERTMLDCLHFSEVTR